MTLRIKCRLVALFAMVALLIVTQGAMAESVQLGTIRGHLGPENLLDGFIVSPASDWNGLAARLLVFPDTFLDVEVCIALVLPTGDGFIRRELRCSDVAGRGQPDAVQEFITGADFPNFTWRVNALLAVEVWRFSGSGNYSGKVFADSF